MSVIRCLGFRVLFLYGWGWGGGLYRPEDRRPSSFGLRTTMSRVQGLWVLAYGAIYPRAEC